MRTHEEIHARLQMIIRWFNVIPDEDTDDTEYLRWDEDPSVPEGEIRALAWVLEIPLDVIYQQLPVADSDPEARHRYERRKNN